MKPGPLPPLRFVTAALVGAIAGIHLDLWSAYGYRHIPTIGPLFLLNVTSGGALALTCLVLPTRYLAPAGISTALFALGTVTALLVSCNVGLFGFAETTRAPLFAASLTVEAATVISALCLAALSARGRISSGPADS